MPRVREVDFEHIVTAWTVGDLRRALQDAPDDARLVVTVADEPGSKLTGPEQVVIAGGWQPKWIPPARVDGKWVEGRHDENDRTVFELELEFPSGTYTRTVDDDGSDQ